MNKLPLPPRRPHPRRKRPRPRAAGGCGPPPPGGDAGKCHVLSCDVMRPPRPPSPAASHPVCRPGPRSGPIPGRFSLAGRPEAGPGLKAGVLRFPTQRRRFPLYRYFTMLSPGSSSRRARRKPIPGHGRSPRQTAGYGWTGRPSAATVFRLAPFGGRQWRPPPRTGTNGRSPCSPGSFSSPFSPMPPM